TPVAVTRQRPDLRNRVSTGGSISAATDPELAATPDSSEVRDAEYTAAARSMCCGLASIREALSVRVRRCRLLRYRPGGLVPVLLAKLGVGVALAEGRGHAASSPESGCHLPHGGRRCGPPRYGAGGLLWPEHRRCLHLGASAPRLPNAGGAVRLPERALSGSGRGDYPNRRPRTAR